MPQRPFVFGLLACIVFFGLGFVGIGPVGRCSEREPAGDGITSAERGYQLLRTAHYLPHDFDEATFGELWKQWPEPDRTRAEGLSEIDRRKAQFDYYGLVEAPESEERSAKLATGKPAPAFGYAPGADGKWVMTCLACHGGYVNGQPFAGAPNTMTALQTLTEDVSATKLAMKKPLTHMDYGLMQLPLNMTNGTTNSVIFGVILGAYRRPDMTVDLSSRPPPVVHHDMDAQPFWNVKKKRSLYADGFAPKTARVVMQFMMLPKNSAETMAGWEPDFEHILDWIESVEPPKYPGKVNADLAATGKAVFESNCSQCHGTYGLGGAYEQRTIPIEEIGTDSVRLTALTPAFRQWMKNGWMSHFGEDPVELNPVGYVAPPLDGIWASAPYFHNGSVPTLWDVLHPSQRPAVWKRTSASAGDVTMDEARMGLASERFTEVPHDVVSPAKRRWYFDTSIIGKSNQGHTFPDLLTEDEKTAVLEYLKTL